MAGKRVAGITVEIGGETTKLQSALKTVDSQIGKTKSSLKDINRLLKLDPTNTELLTQKQKLLKSAIEDTEGRLKTLKEADEQAKAQLESGEMGQDKYDALQREIIATEQELKNLKEQAKDSASVLGTQLQEAGTKMKEVGGKISDAGQKLMPASAAVSGIGIASVKAAADFESAMSDVAATMGTTKDDISELSEKAREMGEVTSFSATEAAEGLNILAMSGLDAKEQVSTIEPVLNLAAAGSLSLESAASYATGAIKGFGDSCDNAQYYTDLMAKGATLANTDVNGLGEALSGSAATAKSYGQSADDVTLSLLRLAEQNITGSEATTALSRAMADLYTPTDAAKKALEELSVSAYNADGSARDVNAVIDELSAAMAGMSDEEANAYKNTIFTTQGLSAFNKMTSTSAEKVDEFREGLASASDGAGSAAEQAQTKLDNLSGQLTILQSAAGEAAISIGEVLMPVVKDVAAKIQEWTDKFNGLSDRQKKVVVVIGAFVAAIGPVLVILGTLISSMGTVVGAIGTLMTFFGGLTGAAGAAGGGLALFSGPLLPIVAIIGAVIGAGVLLYQNWDTIKEKASEISSKISEKWIEIETNVSETVKNIRTKASNAWETMKSDAASRWSDIYATFQEKGGGIKGVIGVLISDAQNTWSTGFSVINTLTGGKLEETLSTAQSKLSSIKKAFSDKMNDAKKTVSDAISSIKSKFNFSWSLPKLKLPHISITGGFSLMPPSVPKFDISWYKKAMDKAYVLNGASIFGSMNGRFLGGGESGSEMVMGKQYMIDMIQQASSQSNDAVIAAIYDAGNEIMNIMMRYFPGFSKQKVVIPERTLARSLREMGVVFK